MVATGAVPRCVNLSEEVLVTRDELLATLSNLPHPIVTDICVFDETCAFRLLTPTAGYHVIVGGAFPIIGPLTVSASQRQALDILSAAQKREAHSKGGQADSPDSEGDYDSFPWHGEGSVRDLLDLDPAIGDEYYMFNDMGRAESAVFRSLESAFDHFVNFYAEVYEDETSSWNSLSDDALADWAESVQQWQSEGAERFPPKNAFGVWYSAAIGGGQIGREDEG